MASVSQVALVTGGASGIGLAVVERLVKNGWHCTVVDFNRETGEKVANDLGDKVIFVKANVAKWEELLNAFQQTWRRWGRLDLVHANAGINDRTPWFAPAKEHEDGSPQQPDTMVIDINLTAVAWCAYLAMHYMRKNDTKSGAIVLTASAVGIYPLHALPLYSVAKVGVVALARTMGDHFKITGDPITVNCICPGMVATATVPTAFTSKMPPQYLSPAELVAEVVEGFGKDKSKQGEAVEVVGTDVRTFDFPKPQDEALKFILSDEGFKVADPKEVGVQLAANARLLQKNLEG